MAQTYSSFDILCKALYDKRSVSVPDFLELYENLLIQRGDENCILHAGRLRQYRKERTDRKYLSDLRKTFNSLYSLIDKEYPDLKFTIEGRIKSFKSMDEKIIQTIAEHKSLDLIRDTMAFRLILFGSYSSAELIDMCYDVMNSIIRNNNANYTLCEANYFPRQVDTTNLQGIIIPKKSKINPRYLYGVKDYIIMPKQNGYQSLHAVFRRQKGGECFEVQVRSFDMHVLAEGGGASHSDYKKRKYKTSSVYDSIDRSKIRFSGYEFRNEMVFDFVGFEKSLQILQRQKTF